MSWAPRVRFQEGIARTVRWYAQNQATRASAVTAEFASYLAPQYGDRLAPKL